MAGNDLRMPLGDPDAIADGIRNGTVSRDCVYTSAKRVLEFILRLA